MITLLYLYLHKSPDHTILPVVGGRVPVWSDTRSGHAATALHQVVEEVVEEVEGGWDHTGSVLR